MACLLVVGLSVCQDSVIRQRAKITTLTAFDGFDERYGTSFSTLPAVEINFLRMSSIILVHESWSVDGDERVIPELEDLLLGSESLSEPSPGLT